MENTSQQRLEKAARLALILTCLFTGTIMILAFLEILILDSTPPLNFLWLGIPAALGAVAGLAVLRYVVLAAREHTLASILSRDWKDPIFYIVALWCVWTFIATFIAIGEGRATLYHNARPLFYAAASLLVVLPLGYVLGRQNRMEFLHFLYDICLWCFVVFLLYIYSRFLRGELHFIAFGHTFDFAGRDTLRFGRNVNTTGAYSTFFLIMELYRIPTLRRKWEKVLRCIAVFILFTTFAFSESRAGVFAVAISLGTYCGVLVYKKNKTTGIWKIILSTASAIISAVAFVLFFYGFLNLLYKAHTVFAAHVAAAQVSAKSVVEAGPAVQDTEDTLGLFDLNGRGEIWRAAITSFFHDPHIFIHGCSRAGIGNYLQPLIKYNMNTHNQILEIFMSHGLIAGLCFLAVLLWTAGKSVSVGLGKTYAETPLWPLPLTLLMVIINNMAEAMLIGTAHITGFFFFLIAGYVGGLAARAKDKEKQP